MVTNSTFNESHELFAGGVFQLRAWRSLLKQAATGLSADCEAICPFGFEVFNDTRFLERDLKRFYILLKVLPDDAGASDEIALEFINNIKCQLALQAPLFYQSVGIWRANRTTLQDRTNKAAPVADRIRMVNVLCRVTREPALVDYARYVIAAIDGILNGTLGEAACFEQSTRARRRLFQLFQILDRVFHATFGTALSAGELHSRALYENELNDLLQGHENQPLTREERESLHNVVLPALGEFSTMLKSKITTTDEIQDSYVADCYSDRRLHLRGSKMRLVRLLGYIESSYLDYV